MKGAEGKKIPGQKIQILVLLDDIYKGSNWYHWRRGRDSNPRGGFNPLHDFQSCTFNHSVTSPAILVWWTLLQPIRTAAEITADIKILPVHQPYLYQKLSQKATQLRLLRMSCEQIAKSLNVNRRTATKACRYKRK